MALMIEPLRAGTLELKNRLVMPPMATAKADPDGTVTPALLQYYAEKSKGGYLSLVITEHSFVSPEGRAHRNQVSAADDDAVPGLSSLARTIHENGSKAIVQLNHAGGAAQKEITGMNPVAPSAVDAFGRNSLPRELDKKGIAGIVSAFQKAAGRVKKAGFDGVEIHSAHFYLLNQFYSPLSNKRMDEYGGNLKNRIRIHLEIIEAVRTEVGGDFPVLLRLGASDYMEGGSSFEDGAAAAREFEKAGISILDISGGICRYAPPESAGVQGFFAPLTEKIKQSVSIPVILTGGITRADAAEQLLSDGKADLIGVGRAILGDSDWAKHAVESLR
jgi:2,4-dienoyl-CoA reductase-like NADH-dependent reductase (Old Yellow Enzyme family)